MAGEPLVGVIMGSDSDWPVMQAAAEALAEFDVAVRGGRLLRAPHAAADARLRDGRGGPRPAGDHRRGAGGAAHLPGMVAAATPLPVIGVPVPLARLDGLDSLLSIVQMPAGVPVATVAVGGARNAGLLAVRILAATDPGAARPDGRLPGRSRGLGAGQGRGPEKHVARRLRRGRSVALHRRGGGPALNSPWTCEVAVR